MEGSYGIYAGEEKVGTAAVSREGLYCCIYCQCCFKEKQIYKIYLRLGENTVLLGTPIPEGKVYVLRKRIPAKLFDAGSPQFTVGVVRENRKRMFVPVKENTPFAHIQQLHNAYAAVNNGVWGVVLITEKNIPTAEKIQGYAKQNSDKKPGNS